MKRLLMILMLMLPLGSAGCDDPIATFSQDEVKQADNNVANEEAAENKKDRAQQKRNGQSGNRFDTEVRR